MIELHNSDNFYDDSFSENIYDFMKFTFDYASATAIIFAQTDKDEWESPQGIPHICIVDAYYN